MDTVNNPYLDMARDWFKSSPSSDLFNDVKGVAIAAVAEYIANQNNTSNYPKKSNGS